MSNTPFDDITGAGVAGGEDEAPESGAIIPFGSDAPVFEVDELFLPRISLTQGLSQSVSDGQAKPGQWYAQGFEPHGEITVVPLGFLRRREYREKETFKLLCHSNDQVTGEGDPGGDCATCPLSQWTDGKGGKRVPPACTPMFSYKVYVKEWQVTALIDFKKTGMAAGKVLNTIIAAHGGKWGTFAVTLGNTQATGQMGTKYFVPKVTPMKAEDAKELLQEAREKQF